MRMRALARLTVAALAAMVLAALFAVPALAAPSYTVVHADGVVHGGSTVGGACRYFSFTPEEDGYYLLRDAGNGDTEMWVTTSRSGEFDEGGVIINDDLMFENGRTERNAACVAHLSAGKTYYITVWLLSSSRQQVNFFVKALDVYTGESVISVPVEEDAPGGFVFTPQESALYTVSLTHRMVPMYYQLVDYSSEYAVFPTCYYGEEELTQWLDTGGIYYVQFGEIDGHHELELSIANAGCFYDVRPGAWYYDVVYEAVETGLVTGYPDDPPVFRPNNRITRGQVATLLFRASGQEPVGDNPFSDVPDGQYYTDAVAWCAASGITTGYDTAEGVLFRPSQYISRQELATMLARYARWANGGEDISGSDAWMSKEGADLVADWATDAIAWGVDHDVIGSNGNLNPRGNATRAEATKMILVSLSA